MDTGTHFVMGFGIAGLSQLDPAVQGDPWVSLAVLIGAVAGSQAPDVDTFTRLWSNASYVRHHRGWSHSIPAWFLWTFTICLPLKLIFPLISLQVLTLWVGLAVVVHVLTDIFNTYGTQALRPLHSRWIALNSIHIFDPFLFLSHVLAILAWLLQLAKPEQLFPGLYTIIALYFFFRTWQHEWISRKLARLDPTHSKGDIYMVLPTIHLSIWNVVKKDGDGHYWLGEWNHGILQWNEQMTCQLTPETERSREHPDVQALLQISPLVCAKVHSSSDGIIIQWLDVRYQHRKQYPLLAVVKYNQQMEVIFSYVGWISAEKLAKRLKRKGIASE